MGVERCPSVVHLERLFSGHNFSRTLFLAIPLNLFSGSQSNTVIEAPGPCQIGARVFTVGRDEEQVHEFIQGIFVIKQFFETD